jgi:hypothetical protein
MMNNNDQFNYQFLGRLQQDCEYYLGFGNRQNSVLWAKDEVEQIQKMREVHDLLPIKPVWCTLEDITRYEKSMVPS